MFILTRGYADLYMGDALIDTLVAGDTYGEPVSGTGFKLRHRQSGICSRLRAATATDGAKDCWLDVCSPVLLFAESGELRWACLRIFVFPY